MRLSKNTYTALILTVTGLVRILQLKESVPNILLNGRGAVLNLCKKSSGGVAPTQSANGVYVL